MQVTIIGGGSYQWTPELLADLLGTESAARRTRRSRGRRTRRPSSRWRRSPGGSTEALQSRRDHQHDDRPAPGARGRRLRRGVHLDRCVREHAPRPRDPRAARHQAVGRRHRRAGRDHAGAAQHPGARRDRPRHGRDLPRRVDAQHHQPDDAVSPGRSAARRRSRRSGSVTRSGTGASTSPSPSATARRVDPRHGRPGSTTSRW